MERAASEPVLRQEDYQVAVCGTVGLPSLGKWNKDPGTNTTRINQIIRQAGKTPGPGKYVAHQDWSKNGGNKFGHGDRGYKTKNTTPAPVHYERSDFGNSPVLTHSIGSKDCLSKNPRIIHGKMPKGKKRSFLDQAIRHGSQAAPGPGQYEMKHHFCDRVDLHVPGCVGWKNEMNKSVPNPAGKKPQMLAPNHYNPNWAPLEENVPRWSVPKEEGANFLDKAVRESQILQREAVHKFIGLPGPGSYGANEGKKGASGTTPQFNDHKLTRGAKHLQLRGLSKSPMSGYM